ncbi:MAG: hypothetical protein JNL42_05725 [Anaerolineae bacterium]|nr:hypothetical protein [Anaerolineae bacterium]
MSQMESGKARAQAVAILVEAMCKPTGLQYAEICAQMYKFLHQDCSIDHFNRLFRGRGTSENMFYDLDELTAFVRALTEGVAPEYRPSAEQAFRLFSLARAPLESFKRLKPFFSEDDYRAAWQPYVNIDLEDEAQRPPPDFLKPVYPSLFIGRDADLAALQRRLGANADGQRAPLSVVRGWPGVGKTALINRLVYDDDGVLRPLYPDGILWTALGPGGDAVNSLRRWARQLGALHIEPIQQPEAVIQEMRFLLQNKRVLLVIDDVWTREQGSLFRSLGSSQTTFLFTTRFTDVARYLAETDENIAFLDVLNAAEAKRLLNLFAGEASQVYAGDIDQLVETLEGLPLALRVAGRLIEQEHRLGFDVRPLLSDLQTNFRGFRDLAPADRFDEATGRTPTIGLLFRRSVQTLPQLDQWAFACIGDLAPKPATFALQTAAEICGFSEPHAVARSLAGRGLLEALGGGRFQMHYTLAMYARHLLATNLAELDEPDSAPS